MGYKWVTVEGSDGKRSFKVSEGSGVFWVYSGSGNSIGKTRSMEDALSLVKSNYSGKVWKVEIGEESSGCFPGSVLVLTPSGGKRIADMRPGDALLSWCAATDTLRPRLVTKRLDHRASRIWEIRTTGARAPMPCTAIHPFLTARGWVRARDLSAGDELASIRGSGPMARTVIAVSRTERFEPVHNLYSEGEHNFIADGFVAHNFAYFRGLRSLWSDALERDAPWRLATGFPRDAG
jgi:hypothetical protein